MTAQLIPNLDDQRIAEQLALAKTLRDQGLTGTGGSGMAGQVYMVGNQYGNLAKSLGGAFAQYMGGKNRDELAAQRTQQFNDYMSQLPSTVESREQFGPATPEGGALPNVEVPKSARQQQQEMNRFALNAPDIPQFAALRQAGMAQALAAPQQQAAAEEAAANRKVQLEMTLADRAAGREERALAAKELAQMRIDAQRDLKILGASLRPPPAPHNVQTLVTDQGILERQADGSWAPIKVGGNVAGKAFTPKGPDAATNKAIHEANIGISNIDRAIGLLDERPSSVGPRYGIPGAELAGQYLDAEGVPVRAAISNVGSLKLHDRSGAAVTVSEFPRLAPFIPTAKDSAPAAKHKLEGLKKEYETIRDEWASGVNTSTLGGSRNSSSKPAATAPAEEWVRGPDGKLMRK